MAEIPDLKADLARAMRWQPVAADQWLDFGPIRKEISRLRKIVGSANEQISTPQIVETVKRFRAVRKIQNYPELKLVCAGIGFLTDDQWCVLVDPELWHLVKQQIAAEAEIKRQLRCFRGMLMNYWSFPINSFQLNSPHHDGWKNLRTWLSQHTQAWSGRQSPEPAWFKELHAYSSLLTEDPCRKYARSFLRDDRTEFDTIVNKFYIPGDSWIHRELVIAPVREVILSTDTSFKSDLDQIVRLISQNKSIQKYPGLRAESTAMLLSRYAECADHPQNGDLQNLALELIGNPWMDRPNWDAQVVLSNGEADNEARQMVDSWLKLRLIRDFFAMLSSDYSTDGARLTYWLGFEPLIEEMWFGLGPNVRGDSSSKYRSFQKNAKGRLLSIRGGGANNNAFFMKIGNFLVIEYGVTGNACFVYRWADLPQVFRDALARPSVTREWDVDELKRMKSFPKLGHMGRWQERFDDEFVKIMGPHIRKRKPSGRRT